MPAASSRRTILASSKRSCTLSTSVGRFPFNFPKPEPQHSRRSPQPSSDHPPHAQDDRGLRNHRPMPARSSISSSRSSSRTSRNTPTTAASSIFSTTIPASFTIPRIWSPCCPARAAPLLHLFESARARWRDPHHRRRRPLPLPQSRPRRRLLHPARRPHSNRRIVCPSTFSPTRSSACPRRPTRPSS